MQKGSLLHAANSLGWRRKEADYRIDLWKNQFTMPSYDNIDKREPFRFSVDPSHFMIP